MYRQTDDHDDLLNSNNILEKKRGDEESPKFIRATHRSVIFDDVDIQPLSEKPLHPSSSRLSKREKCMIVAIVLLVILLIVFIVLYATKAAKGTTKEPQATKAWITLSAGKCKFLSQGILKISPLYWDIIILDAKSFSLLHHVHWRSKCAPFSFAWFCCILHRGPLFRTVENIQLGRLRCTCVVHVYKLWLS